MRRHQNVPDFSRGHQLPLWRLVAGELGWAGRQLVAGPWVLAGLLGGFAATLGVLSATAPGPIVVMPWRLLTAIAVGLLVAAGVRGLRRSVGAARRNGGRRRVDDARPLTGAVELAAALTVAILAVWLIVWVIERV